MLSVIICSISEEQQYRLRKNISETIGVDFEVIAIDNREKKWSIAKSYNYGAKQAKYPYLLFIHEDTKFHGNNWGGVIEEKLAEPTCGVIGFVGSRMRLSAYSPWQQTKEESVANYIQSNPAGLCTRENCVEHQNFREVVVLDGMALFVRKELWENLPFDEENLKGFHCYDIDFTLSAAHAGYMNYVCTDERFCLEHFSPGNYPEEWFETTIRMQQNKWNRMTPIYAKDCKMTGERENKLVEKLNKHFLIWMSLVYEDLKSMISLFDKKFIEQYEYVLPRCEYKNVKSKIQGNKPFPEIKQTVYTYLKHSPLKYKGRILPKIIWYRMLKHSQK